MSNITIKDEYPGVGDPNDYEWYRDLAFYYNSNHELWKFLWDRWKVNGQGEYTNYERLAAREFYYDSPRQRHMWRDVDPDDWYPNYPTHTEHWTDYLGEMPYGDFDMTLTDNDPNYDMQVDEQLRYLTAAGLNAQQTVVDPNTITYFHGDLINSTMLATDPNGDAAASLAYTAFGEPIGDPNELNTRYQYAGGWGYESDLLTLDGVPGTAPITLQHVGARWYQPGIGRFVQRDSISIRGGFNLYLYCGNNPLISVDPTGLLPGESEDNWINNGLAGAWRWLLGDDYLVEASDAELVGIAAGTSVGIVAAGHAAAAAAGRGGIFVARLVWGRGGLHIVYGTGAAGSFHYWGAIGSMVASRTSLSGFPIFAWPVRFPWILGPNGGPAYNCVTGAFWEFIRSL